MKSKKRNSMLKLAQKTTVRIKLKHKIIAGSIVFSLISFIAIFLFNNLGNSKISSADEIENINENKDLSVKFNGTTDGINIGNVELNLTDKFTVCAWVKWDIEPSTGNSWANMVTYTSSSNGDGGMFWFQHDNKNSKFEFALTTISSSNGKTNRRFIQSTTKPVKNQWYHLAGVYDGTRMYFYINGVLEGSASKTGNIVSKSSYELTIGKWAANGRQFQGEIDEVSICSKALDVDDVRDVMCLKANTNCSHLEGYWNFNNDSIVAIDGSTNNYDGVVNGTYKLSGAPIGMESDWNFDSNIEDFSFTNSNGEKITIDNITGNLNGILIYNTDTLTNLNSSLTDLTKKSWGVFFSSSEDINYRMTYDYSQTPNITDETKIGLVNKQQNDSINWNIVDDPILDVVSKTISKSFKNRMEFRITQKTPSSLPVSFLEVSAENNNNGGIMINWATASELNNDYFTVEHSLDGIEYKSIGFVNGAGNSNTILKYDFEDESPNSGTNYYRIRQTDFDGKNATSDIVSINNSEVNDSEANINIYPNPFTNYLTINIEANFEDNIIINISNHLGQIIRTEQFECYEGNNSFNINSLEKLKKGTYYIMIKKDNEIIKTTKVLKII